MEKLLHTCTLCMAVLQADDGHDCCPSCLGLEHLKQGLTEDACMNCSVMSSERRTSRITMVQGLLGESLPPPPPRKTTSKRKNTESTSASAGKRSKEDPLGKKVDVLAAEFAQIKALLMKLQPGERLVSSVEAPAMESPIGEEDILSMAASQSQFYDDVDGEMQVLSDHQSQFSHDGSQEAGHGSAEGPQSEQELVKQALQAALARLGLDAAPAVATSSSAFFRGSAQPSPLTIPPSKDYIEELQRCWANPRSLTHPTSASRALAAMQDADTYGLGQMPKVDPFIASFVLSPEEVLRPNVRCPRPQCRITDDHLIQAYNTAARMGRIGNSLSHIMLALSQSLQSSGSDPFNQNLSDASLQAIAFMTRELGRLMSTLTQARRQVWLAQSPLSEACRRTLRDLPVVPGQLFGPAAQETLERSVQVNQTRQQFADLRRVPQAHLNYRQPSRGYELPRSTFSARSGDVHRSQPSRSPRVGNAAQRPRARGQQEFQAPRGRAPGQRPTRDARGHGRRS
jgi:hypothetical protein